MADAKLEGLVLKFSEKYKFKSKEIKEKTLELLKEQIKEMKETNEARYVDDDFQFTMGLLAL